MLSLANHFLSLKNSLLANASIDTFSIEVLQVYIHCIEIFPYLNPQLKFLNVCMVLQVKINVKINSILYIIIKHHHADRAECRVRKFIIRFDVV